MSEWHGTCFFSNTSIHEGERAIAFILKPHFKKDRRVVSYHDDFNQMIGFALVGEYDGWGSLRNIVPDPHMEAYLQNQDLYVKETKGYECSYHKYEWVSLEDFVNKINRGKMYIQGLYNFEIIEMVMIHYELYQQLMNEMRNRIPYSKKITFETHTRNKVCQILDIKQQEKAVVEERVAKIEADDSMDEEKQISQIIRLNIQKSEFHRLWANDDFHHLNFMADRYIENPDETIINGIVDTIIWHQVMTFSRVGYFCVPGSGSDDYEMMIPLIVANFVKELYKKRCSKKNMGRETLFVYGIDNRYLPLLN